MMPFNYLCIWCHINYVGKTNNYKSLFQFIFFLNFSDNKSCSSYGTVDEASNRVSSTAARLLRHL